MKHGYPEIFCSLTALLTTLAMGAQEPESFTRGDFQLRGPVKTCVVKANYGEERFEFDREGRLLKSQTRYSDADYDITHYIFEGHRLKERRHEVYRNRQFDQQTSLAHFYQRDTAAHRTVEKIVSYDRNLQEQQVLEYDSIGRLQRLVRSDLEGVDETLLEYSSFKEEETVTYRLNGVLLKTVRTSHQPRGNQILTVTLTKEYLDGQPQRAYEETRDPQGRLVGKTRFSYDREKGSFSTEATTRYSYNQDGLLLEETTRLGEGGEPQIRKYIYQMDGADPGNWIRQVVTPEYTIVVRQITYYKPEVPEKPADSVRG